MRRTPDCKSVVPVQTLDVVLERVSVPEPTFFKLLPMAPLSLPEKIVEVLSPPTVRTRPDVVDPVVTMPEPAKEPIVSLPAAIARVPLAPTVTGLVFSNRSAAVMLRVPALMKVGPVKVAATPMLRTPGPALVRPPAPLMTPDNVKVTAASVTSIVALPPCKANVWEAAPVADMVAVAPV